MYVGNTESTRLRAGKPNKWQMQQKRWNPIAVTLNLFTWDVPSAKNTLPAPIPPPLASASSPSPDGSFLTPQPRCSRGRGNEGISGGTASPHSVHSFIHLYPCAVATWCTGTSMTLRSDKPPHWLDLWPWASCSTPLTLSFLNCKMGIIISTS